MVRNQYGGDMQFVVNAAQPVAQVFADLGIKRAERLIEQQHLGRTANARARATRCRCPPEKSIGMQARIRFERNELEQFFDTFVNFFARRPDLALLHAQSECNVSEDRHVPEESVMLKDEADAATGGKLVRGLFAMQLNRA